MRRQRTVPLSKEAVDFMVLEYSCIDSTVLSSLGKHCKETTWKLAVGSGTIPIDIKVHVDKNVMSSPQVRVDWDGAKIYPRGQAGKERLREDFTWCVPYRGVLKGLAVKNHFEVRPEHGVGEEAWYPATLTEQRPDGCFAAIVEMPSGNGGTREVSFPVVQANHIRQAGGMKGGISVPRRQLVLKVPAQDPLHAVLSVDSGELITHFFVRPTPPPTKDEKSGASLVKPRILLKVSRDREHVTSDVGHEILTHFLDGGARAISEDVWRQKKAWTLQLGPFAEHKIELERRYKSSKVMSLIVDGDVLCESAGEDIESRPGYWECSFRLEGERYLDWEVYETDAGWRTLGTTGLVRQKRKCCYECVVLVSDDEKDLREAQLIVDDKDFEDLPRSRMAPPGDVLDVCPEALKSTYDLEVPHKASADSLFAFISKAQEWTNNNLRAPAGNTSVFGFSFFTRCCGKPQLGPDDMLLKPSRSAKGS